MIIKLKSEADAYAVINAMRVAAERYDLDAATMRAQTDGHQQLAGTFDAQAATARRIADEIEEQS